MVPNINIEMPKAYGINEILNELSGSIYLLAFDKLNRSQTLSLPFPHLYIKHYIMREVVVEISLRSEGLNI